MQRKTSLQPQADDDHIRIDKVHTTLIGKVEKTDQNILTSFVNIAFSFRRGGLLKLCQEFYRHLPTLELGMEKRRNIAANENLKKLKHRQIKASLMEGKLVFV